MMIQIQDPKASDANESIISPFVQLTQLSTYMESQTDSEDFKPETEKHFEDDCGSNELDEYMNTQLVTE